MVETMIKLLNQGKLSDLVKRGLERSFLVLYSMIRTQ